MPAPLAPGPQLLETLRASCPAWGPRELQAVGEKLTQVGVVSNSALAASLSGRPGLNRRLQGAGLKAFSPATISALRAQLAEEAGPAEQQEVASLGAPPARAGLQEGLPASAPLVSPGEMPAPPDGCYEVLCGQAPVHGAPSQSAEAVRSLVQGTAVAGWGVCIAGTPWLRLNDETREALGMIAENLFMQVRRLEGGGIDLLRWLGDRPCPVLRYEVVHSRVAVRTSPSTASTHISALTRGAAVSGWPLDSEGEPWLRLDPETRGRLQLPRAVEAFVLMHGQRLGLGILLRCMEDDLAHRGRGRLDELGETALIAAVRQGSTGIIRELLQQRADPNAQDSFGETALMEAASQGDAETCKLLLKHNADPARSSPSGLSAKDLAKEHKQLRELFREADFWREDALREAAGRHDEARAEELLQGWEAGGLELSRADADGATALHLCAARPPESGAAARIARLLVGARASVNATNLLGETPLILSARCSADVHTMALRLELPRALLGSGASPNASDAVLHETALMEAAGVGDPELVILLIEGRADPSRTSASGRSAHDFAAGAEVKRILVNPQRAIEESRRRANAAPPQPKPRPPPRPKPHRVQYNHTSFAPQTHGTPSQRPAAQAEQPSAFPRKLGTIEERIADVLVHYPGFVSAGMEVPPEATPQQWTTAELELFVGSMGQLWPHGRPRSSSSAPPRRGGASCDQGARPARPPASVLRPHCRALEVPETVSDWQVLKRAYRRLALRWHPDKNTSDPDAARRFQEVSASYEFLCRALGLQC